MPSTPYTYLLGWSEHNTWYYGVRYAKGCHPSDIWKKYFTSSKHVKNFVKMHGDPDVIEVRRVFDNSDSAKLWEMTVLRRMNVLKDDRWLNKNIGGKNFGNSWVGRKHKTESKEKIRSNGKNQFTPERAAHYRNLDVINGTHVAINAAKEGRHHWQTKTHSKLISKRNTKMFRDSVTVTDKYGMNMRIPKEDFLKQQIGPRKEWTYVGVASKEGKERRVCR
jgi:hypothetical protein